EADAVVERLDAGLGDRHGREPRRRQRAAGRLDERAPADARDAAEVQDVYILAFILLHSKFQIPNYATRPMRRLLVACGAAPEIAAARATSRRIWAELVDGRQLPSWFVDALVELTARRAVTPLFEQLNRPPGFAFIEERFFGGFVPKFVRVRRLAETDGDPLAAYHARPRAAANAAAIDARSLTAKT